MNTFDRAAIVSAVVGVLFVALTGWLAASASAMGATGEALVPLLLGPGLKGTLALSAAAVFAVAGKAERRRQGLMAAARKPTELSAMNDDEPVHPSRRAA
ncbi:MAG: hypothetical protein AAGF49_10640 [Pseudomonadota bacterium]